MPTSGYMPDVKVQVAWDGGFRVPMADWTWTDVSAYVELAEGMSIAWGRGDERSNADANTLTLTLDNSDGRFTAGRVTGVYYPDVVLYKPIRVLATPVDGAEMPLFTGYVTSWPVEWESTDAYAKATVTAVSRLARLGLNARWRSIVEETVLADSPVVYYPLGDPEGSTLASDVSGNGAAPLSMVGAGAAVVFGQATGPGTDDLTAATFASGQWLRGGGLGAVGGYTCSAFALLDSGGGLLISLNTAGEELEFSYSGSDVKAERGAFSITASATPGATHHLAVTVETDGTTSIYVDGALEVSGAGPVPASSIDSFDVGEGYDGVIAHAAVFDTALTGSQIEAHAIAGLTGWVGETTAERFERYANMAGIVSAEIAAETGSTTVGHIDATGQNVVDLLRIMETTEAGVVFDALDGTLTLHNRAHRYANASSLTLDMAKHEVGADYSPRLDPLALFNDITVTGVVTAHLKPTQVELNANGLATASMTTASEDADEPLRLASWARLQFATPKPRVPSLSASVTDQAAMYESGDSTVSSADLMAVTIGDRITVANHPQQAATSITDYLVEGGSFSIGPESMGITWNVSPSSPDDTVLIWGDTLRGVWGTNAWAL